MILARSTRRHGHRANTHEMFEQLEARQLLAFAIADYFPVSGGNTWQYSGTENGLPATSSVTSTAGVAEGGASTTRFQTQFVSSPELSRTVSNFFNVTGAGLRWFRADVTIQGATTVFRFASGGVITVPASVTDGQVFSFSAPYTSGSGGNAGSGLLSATRTYLGLEEIVTPAGTFTALKVVESSTENGQINGVMYSGTLMVSSWLVRGLGGVRIESNVHVTNSNGGDLVIATDISLTSSSLLRFSLTGRNIPIANGDSTPTGADGTNFGGADVAGVTRIRRFTLQNGGAGTINIGSVTLSGTNAAEFTLFRMPAATLGPGQTTIFSVRFNPSAAGFRNAIASVATSDPVANPFTFSLRGRGLIFGEVGVRRSDSLISISDGSTIATLEDGTVFGTRRAARHRVVDRTFVVSNTGLGELSLSSVFISGDASADFTITSNFAASVSSGATTSFTIRFDPSQIGARFATIQIASNDRTAPLFTFVIVGTGT